MWVLGPGQGEEDVCVWKWWQVAWNGVSEPKRGEKSINLWVAAKREWLYMRELPNILRIMGVWDCWKGEL